MVSCNPKKCRSSYALLGMTTLDKRAIEYAEFNGDVHFFCFRPEVPFLGKVRPNNHNCYFKLRFGIKTNFNMQNSMLMFTFSVFNWKYLF